MKDIQYTIRKIPLKVDEALRSRAKRQGKRLNETLLDSLKTSSGMSGKAKTRRNLDWFFGSGGISKEEEQAFKDQRTIERGAWRQ